MMKEGQRKVVEMMAQIKVMTEEVMMPPMFFGVL